MLDKITKQIPFTTIIIAYFFLCGGFYLMGFWKTFNVDITNFIGIQDIPKSFIFPFFITQGTYLITAYLTVVNGNNNEYTGELTKPLRTWKRLWEVLFSFQTMFLLLAGSFGFLADRWGSSATFWSASAYFFSLILYFRYANYTPLKLLIPNKIIRHYLVYMAISLPLLGFASGKFISLNLYNNKAYKLVEISDGKDILVSQKDSLKLIGFLGDKLFISTLDNKNLSIYNQSDFTSVKLFDVLIKDK
jgi:hypothetical protein